jgi:subtilase family serine protease
MRRRRAISFSVLSTLIFSLFLVGPMAQAQNGRAALITQNVDESKLAPLAGNTRPEANKQNDRGLVADSLAMEHMLLQLRRSPKQERELLQFIEELQTPSSPNFHHWLTAKEYGERFGLATQDRDVITHWLESHGFKVEVVYENGTLIDFSGTAGQVRSAFHTEIHELDVNGVKHFANMEWCLCMTSSPTPTTSRGRTTRLAMADS